MKFFNPPCIPLLQRGKKREEGIVFAAVVSFFLLLLCYSFTSVCASGTSSTATDNAMFHYLLYERYFNEGKYLDGLKELERAIEIDGDSVFLLKEIIPVYFDMGNYDEVLKIARKLLEKTEKNYTAFYYIASVYEIRDEIDSAVKYYEQASKLSPENADVDFSLGRIYMKQKKYGRAGELFEKAVTKDPENPVMRLTLAVFYEAEKKWDKAVEQYREIYRINPASPNSILKAGEIYIKLGRMQEAKKIFTEVLEKEPENSSALMSLAAIYERDKQWDKVIDVLMKIHKINDGYPEVEMYLGLAFMQSGSSDTAKEYFKRAVSIAPDNAALHYSLALIYIDAEEYLRAIDELEKCEEYGGESSEVSFMKGVCKDTLGDKETAYEFFKNAIKIDPENHRALNYLSYSWAEEGKNLKQAMKYAEKALKLSPDNAAYIDTAGWIQYKSGNYKEALNLLKKASRLMDDPVIWEHLGDAYLKLKKKDAARKAYSKAALSGADKEKIKKKIEKVK
ncbi:MAG: hypothetical protein COT16_00385 [Elusimicrobia bacterium CG08_land_8_20_14_0_20_44_26]|nr:MAG: hypothetical protein COT16_00385 [Elusimicrobia bacterium CG08_land_8_20_14_0_20_44_26]